MVRKSLPRAMSTALARGLGPVLVIVSILLTGCGVGSIGGNSVGTIVATQEVESDRSTPTLPSATATVTEAATGVAAELVTNAPLDYCFEYPEGFTKQINDSQVEIVGPSSSSSPEPGLVWIDATDAQGRTAEDVANQEESVVGGVHPRSTVMLGGEEALVLDGMPGQDAVRKVYIVHRGLLYTLTFSPYRSANSTANAQMETLFASVTLSWAWISSGATCGADK